MPPKTVRVQRQPAAHPQEKASNYFTYAYREITSPENASVVRSVLMFGVSTCPFPFQVDGGGTRSINFMLMRIVSDAIGGGYVLLVELFGGPAAWVLEMSAGVCGGVMTWAAITENFTVFSGKGP